MSEPYLGEIKLFGGNFAPRGYMFCQGQLLQIQQYTALFAILGVTYGGNGSSNFALPDLRGRVPVGFGQGPGLSTYQLGQVSGAETVTLQANQLPAHSHTLPATNTAAETTNPVGAVPAKGGSYVKGSSAGAATPSGQVGGNQPHSNVQPILGLNYIIAVVGLFPARN